MKLLLDTQTFIWLINDDKRLGAAAQTILHDPATDLSLSYFSVFEMIIKASIGKLEFDHDVISDLPKMGVELLLPGPKSLVGYKIFNPDNNDPFDNALITTALNEELVIMTSDDKILNTNTVGLRLVDTKL